MLPKRTHRGDEHSAFTNSERQLILAAESREIRIGASGEMPRRQRLVPLAPRITEEDREAHRAFIATLGDKPVWNEFLMA